MDADQPLHGGHKSLRPDVRCRANSWPRARNRLRYGPSGRLEEPNSSADTHDALQCERDGAVAVGPRQAESEGAFHYGQERSGGHLEIVLVHVGLDAVDQEPADERIEFGFELRSRG